MNSHETKPAEHDAARIPAVAGEILHKRAVQELTEITAKHVTNISPPPPSRADITYRLLRLNFRRAHRHVAGFFERNA